MDFSEIAITVITALVGIIGFFVKRAYDSLDKKATKGELAEAKKDIEACKADISQIKGKYLTKDDYFREQERTDKKLDRILEMLITISKGGDS